MKSNNNLALKRVDQVQLQRGLLIVLGVVLTVIIAGYTVKSGNPLFMVGFVALPFVLMLMYRPELALVGAVLLDTTGMQIPGVSYTTLGLLAKVVVIAAAALAFFMGQSRNQRRRIPEDKPLKWFIAVIIVLMAVRGSGLRALGSTTWGGMIYVNLLLGIAFFWAVRGLTLQKKHILWMAWGGLCFGVVGSLMSYGGWASVMEEGSVMASRLRWLSPLAYAFFPIALAYKSRGGVFVSAFLIIVGIGLFAITGDRKLFIYAFMVLAGYGFFKSRSKGRYVFLVAAAGLMLWIGLIIGAKVLPLGMQRAVSILPGVNVNYSMGRDAEGSMEWRIDIWKYCLSQVKQYLVIGRGSAFDVMATSANLSQDDIATFSPWFAYETRSYHSGPLSLLIDYGFLGLISMFFFMGLAFRRLWGAAKKLALMNSFISRYALVLCVSLLATIVKFFFIMGAIPELAKIIGMIAVAYIVVSTVLDSSDQPDDGHIPPELEDAVEELG